MVPLSLPLYLSISPSITVSLCLFLSLTYIIVYVFVAEGTAVEECGSLEPKLEDFLGGGGREEGDVGNKGVIYDSDLKAVAAGFLPGSAAEESPEQQTLEISATVSDSKKAVDTFGHRTSIYRGVTR